MMDQKNLFKWLAILMIALNIFVLSRLFFIKSTNLAYATPGTSQVGKYQIAPAGEAWEIVWVLDTSTGDIWQFYKGTKGTEKTDHGQ